MEKEKSEEIRRSFVNNESRTATAKTQKPTGHPHELWSTSIKIIGKVMIYSRSENNNCYSRN